MYCTSDVEKKLTKDECRQYLKDVEECKWTDFDEMIQSIQKIRIIKLCNDEWENSECTCPSWQKDYKCNHVISLASRLRLASFATVAYSIPLQHKRKRGKPKSTASALSIQPSDYQEEVGVELCSEDEEPEEPIVQEIKRKRGRPAKNPAEKRFKK